MYVLSYVCVFLPTISSTNKYSGMYDQKAIVIIRTTTLERERVISHKQINSTSIRRYRCHSRFRNFF
jgi:hypothetical protein